jgi:hypothetical protein
MHKMEALFTGTLGLEQRKKLANCYIWGIALQGAETGTLWAVDRRQLESFGMWCWRRSAGPIVWEMKKYNTQSWAL